MRPKLHLLPAIFSVVFAIHACQDSPTALTEAGGPLVGAKKCESPPCGGGGPGPGGDPSDVDANVSASDGMVTQSPQGMRIVTDNKRLLRMEPPQGDGEPDIRIAFNLVQTHAAAVADWTDNGSFDTCLIDPFPADPLRIAPTLDFMIEAEQSRAFGFDVDKRSLDDSSSDHVIRSTTFTDGLRSLRLGGRSHLAGPEVVGTLDGGQIDGDSTVTFSSGIVHVLNRTGEQFTISCPNAGDEVTLTIDRL
jgi:hypothetical protein